MVIIATIWCKRARASGLKGPMMQNYEMSQKFHKQLMFFPNLQAQSHLCSIVTIVLLLCVLIYSFPKPSINNFESLKRVLYCLECHLISPPPWGFLLFPQGPVPVASPFLKPLLPSWLPVSSLGQRQCLLNHIWVL